MTKIIIVDKNKNKKETIVKIDKNYFRPNEVNSLRGNSKKIFNKLGFKPKTSLNDLIDEMIYDQINKLK